MKKFLRENGLSLTLASITLLTLAGNVVTGWHEHNEERREYNHPDLSFGTYLTSGHCIESVFENWESEFLQIRAIAPNSEELENLEQKAIVTGGFLAFPFDTGHYVDFR